MCTLDAMRWALLIAMLFCGELFAERGIVVALNDRFAQEFFLVSLSSLREERGCQLPIEIWHSGDELSRKMKRALKKFSGVSFRDIAKVLRVPKKRYRGWQIKPWIIQLSRFDEVILMDADLFFFENPEVLFSHPGYQKTGAFFFADLSHKFPSFGEVFTLEKYLDRRKFIRSLVSAPSACVLEDMATIWSEEVPTMQNPFVGDLQESGCVVMDKRRHQKSLAAIIQLNEDRKETYRHVHGDKETFWLGCEMTKTPYYMNPQRPCSLESGTQKVYVVQFLEGRLFYQQKFPIPLEKKAFFVNGEGLRRPLSEKEREQLSVKAL